MRKMLLALAAVVPVFAGCGKYTEDLVIFPDGSGKLTFTVGMWNPLRGEHKIGDKKFDLAMHEGFVAWTTPVESKPPRENVPAWHTVTFTGYFEDISKVRIMGEDRKPRITFSLKREGEGFVLEVDDALFEGPQRVPQEKRAETWALLQPQLGGFELIRRVRMPGPITSFENYTPETPRGKEADGTPLPRPDLRVVEQNYKGEWIKELHELEFLAGRVKRKVVCGASQATEAETAAFRKELEEVRAKSKSK